jgi:hypothetical protein
MDVDGMAYDFPEVDDFILHMAASLAKTCKPYWMLDDDAGSEFKVTLFVPTARERASAEKYVAALVADDKVKVEVHPELEEAGDSTQNPFILVAYSTQGADGLEQIRSLNYYTEPGVLGPTG